MPDNNTLPNDEEVLLKKARAQNAGGTLTSNVVPGQGMVLPSAIDAYRQRAANLYSQGSQLYNAEPDVTQLQEFARNQGRAGEGAMLNALAAQYAGEGFQPVQAQYLKKAAAAQEPMKMGSGILTPDGKYIKDPFSAQDKKAEFLMQQARAYEQMATNAQTAQERAAAMQAQNEISNQLRLMGLQIQQMNAGNSGEQRNWRGEDTLRGDFDKLTKDLREELNSTSKITQIVNATPVGQKPDAITQQSLVILLNKFLDPGSVVREGEFDRVVKAQGLEGQARNLADRVLKGQPLDANTIKQIDGLAKFYNQAATQKIQSIANNYSDIATRRNLNVENVISDPRFRGKRNVVVDY